MSEQTPQPPQIEEIEDEETIVSEEVPSASTETGSEEVPSTNAEAGSEETPQITYHQYLKLLNPEKSDEEIAKMIRKENRYAWIVRFQILSIIVFLIIILVFIFGH